MKCISGNLIGQVFNRLTVVSRVANSRHGASRWNCACTCGNSIIATGSCLRRSVTKSCGCFMREEASRRTRHHGMAGTRIYRIWSDMKKRCNRPNHKNFDRYGGRGIKICAEWQNFQAFHTWAIESGYSDELTIDRFPDRDGNYEPTNCRWATQAEQIRNQDRYEGITFRGQTKTIAEFAREMGLNEGTVRQRINVAGWSIEKALLTPARNWGR